MTKTDLIAAIAEKGNLPKTQAETMLNALLESIQEGLVQGESVTLVGFGTFSVTSRAARKGRNPKTGETLEIAASKAVKFSPGKALKESVA